MLIFSRLSELWAWAGRLLRPKGVVEERYGVGQRGVCSFPVSVLVLGATLASLAPMGAVGIYAAVAAQRSQRAEAEGRLLELSRLAATELDAEVQPRVTAAEMLGSLTFFDNFPSMLLDTRRQLFQFVRDFGTSKPDANFAIWDVNGPTPIRVISTHAPFELFGSPATVAEAISAIRNAAERRQPTVSATYKSDITGKFGLLVAYPVQRHDRTIAVITVTMPLARVQEILDGLRLPPDSSAALTHSGRYVVARNASRFIGQPVTDEYRAVTEVASEGKFRASNLDGVPTIAAFAHGRLAPDYVITVAAPVAVVEADWVRTRNLLLAGAASALFIAATVFALSRRAWKSAQGFMQSQAAHLTHTLDSAGLATWESDLSTGVALWSPRHFDLIGHPRSQDGSATTAMWWQVIHPDDLETVRDQWRRRERLPDATWRATYRILRRDNGEVRWCETIGRFSSPTRMIGVMMDVTEARLEDEHRQLLAREVDHRAKNMLAVVQAMIAMTKAKDIRSLRESLTHRLMSLAKTHTLLAQNHWTGSSVREVAESELRSYGTAVRLIGDDITLRCEAVQPLAMALHELITNAAKYGALSAERGIVAASWRVEGPNLRIEWKERGGPSVEAPTRSGFGIRMISRVLAQIGGHIEFSWTQAGLSAHIAIPIDRICDPRHAPATSRPIHASEPMIS